MGNYLFAGSKQFLGMLLYGVATLALFTSIVQQQQHHRVSHAIIYVPVCINDRNKNLTFLLHVTGRVKVDDCYVTFQRINIFTIVQFALFLAC